MSEIQVDPRQPRAGESPEKTANVATIAEGLDVDDAGGAHPLQPIVLRPTPPWAPDQSRPYMIKFGECRYLGAEKREAKTIDAELVVTEESSVFEAQVKENMSRDGLSPSAQMYSVKMFDDQNPGVSAANAGVRLGMPTDTVRSLRRVNTLPSGPRLRFMAGSHTLEVCALLAQIEGATPEERAERQEAASKAVEAMEARKAKAHIRATYFLLLKTAPFDREDEALNPGAGKCSACKFRSGAQASLFASTDEAEDTCTKKSCWDAKAAAALAAKQADVPVGGAEPEKTKPAKKEKVEKPRKEDLTIAAYLARGDIASEDLEGHCGGMSSDAINEALVRLEAAGNERAKYALQDRKCEDPSPYSCGSAKALACSIVELVREANARMNASDLSALARETDSVLFALAPAPPSGSRVVHDDEPESAENPGGILVADYIPAWEDETMSPPYPFVDEDGNLRASE